MLPDRVSNPGLLTCESGALPIALRGPACRLKTNILHYIEHTYSCRVLLGIYAFFTKGSNLCGLLLAFLENKPDT